MTKIAVLTGDGIGPEIISAALSVLDKVQNIFDLQFEINEGVFGGAAYETFGNPFPEETWNIVQNSQAVLLGAVGGAQWDNLERELRPESALLVMRKKLGLYANIRPVKYYPSLAEKVVWKPEVLEGVDFMIFRELTGGAYFGRKERLGDRAIDAMEYSREEIIRIVTKAFEMASARRRILHSIDKANVLETSRLWRETVNEIGRDYPEVRVEHLYVDNAAIQLVINPQQFDVIVTENLFGDILSDQAAAISGSLGMLPSASLGGEINLYEPAHGSAPDIAGKNLANPLATILSVAMLLRYTMKNEKAALAIENAVESVLKEGYATGDIAGAGSKRVGTKEMAELVAAAVVKA